MIDEKRQLFPICIVWTVLPCISWLIPVIGHAAICEFCLSYSAKLGRFMSSWVITST